MNIDERIERLAERHQALTQAVELLAAENRERDARLAAEFAQIRPNFEICLDAIRGLERIAAVPEARLSRLEGE